MSARRSPARRALSVALLAAGALAPGFLWSEQLAVAPPPAHAAPRAPAAPAWEAPDPAPLPPVAADEYRCEVPDVEIEKAAACDRGAPYPYCHHQLPEPWKVERSYTVWRNTSPEHRTARLALVNLALATAAEYSRIYPGEVLAIGDLDAPGPRHETHDEGVDMDLYLPSAMAVENLGLGEYGENYADLTPLQRRMRQGRVETLARILATCTNGRLRIFYNDEEVEARFLAWYRARGFEESELGPPMRAHNDLHRFHFHVTIPQDSPDGPDLASAGTAPRQPRPPARNR